MVARRGAYRVLIGKHEGKRPLGRPSLRWEDNIRIDFREISLGTWTLLIWLRTRRSDVLLRMRL
jgi:hypothetical protein